jgi:hypothetical protein
MQTPNKKERKEMTRTKKLVVTVVDVKGEVKTEYKKD